MKLPCEIVVSKFFPLVRALVTRELKDHFNLSGRNIATLLGTTDAAVSQYIHHTRGDNEELLKKFPELVGFSHDAAQLLKEKSDKEEDVELTMMLGKICMMIRNNPNFDDVGQGFGACQSCHSLL